MHLGIPFLKALQWLQPETAARAGAALGVLAHYLGIRRRVVGANLKTAFPHWPGCRRRAYGFQASATMGANFLEIWTSGPTMRAKAGVATPRTIAAEISASQGALVLVTPHLGQWDLGPAGIIDNGISNDPMLCFATFQRQAAVDSYLNECRERLAVKVELVNVGDKRGPLAGLRTLRAGHGIGLLADQGTHPERGQKAWFMGQAVIAHKGAGFLTKRSKAPMMVGCCLRTSATRSVSYVFPLPQPGPEVPEEDVTQQAMDAMGRLIAAAPGQYFWHHKRFKRRVEHTGTPDQSYRHKLAAFYREQNLNHDEE